MCAVGRGYSVHTQQEFERPFTLDVFFADEGTGG